MSTTSSTIAAASAFSNSSEHKETEMTTTLPQQQNNITLTTVQPSPEVNALASAGSSSSSALFTQVISTSLIPSNRKTRQGKSKKENIVSVDNVNQDTLSKIDALVMQAKNLQTLRTTIAGRGESLSENDKKTLQVMLTKASDAIVEISNAFIPKPEKQIIVPTMTNASIANNVSMQDFDPNEEKFDASPIVATVTGCIGCIKQIFSSIWNNIDCQSTLFVIYAANKNNLELQAILFHLIRIGESIKWLKPAIKDKPELATLITIRDQIVHYLEYNIALSEQGIDEKRLQSIYCDASLPLGARESIIQALQKGLLLDTFRKITLMQLIGMIDNSLSILKVNDNYVCEYSPGSDSAHVDIFQNYFKYSYTANKILQQKLMFVKQIFNNHRDHLKSSEAIVSLNISVAENCNISLTIDDIQTFHAAIVSIMCNIVNLIKEIDDKEFKPFHKSLIDLNDKKNNLVCQRFKEEDWKQFCNNFNGLISLIDHFKTKDKNVVLVHSLSDLFGRCKIYFDGEYSPMLQRITEYINLHTAGQNYINSDIASQNSAVAAQQKVPAAASISSTAGALIAHSLVVTLKSTKPSSFCSDPELPKIDSEQKQINNQKS